MRPPAIVAWAAILTLAAAGPAADYSPLAAKQGAIWVESESYAAQRGSQAASYEMKGASAGRIVDNDWGGREGDFLRYRVTLPADWPKVLITIRYARALAGSAVVRLTLDPNQPGAGKRAALLHLPDTGGWGFGRSQWRFARAMLPAARKGGHVLEIRSARAGQNNVNTDGFFVSATPVRVPTVPADPPPRLPGPDAEALARAVRHLTRTYPKKYPRGKEFLAQAARLARAWSAAPATGGERQKIAAALSALRREALVEANPLLAFEKLLFTRRHPVGGQHYAYTENLSWNGDRPRSWRPGSALCTLDPRRRGAEPVVLLSSPTGVIRDPDVRWDGRRVIFAHKKSLNDDDYHLYELDVPTGRISPLTQDAGFADYEACYLPDGRVLFNSTRCVQTVDCFPVPVSNLYAMGADGSNIHRLTVNHVHDNFPTVLADGRVVFTRWEYNDRWVLHVQGLAVMNPDGTGTTALYGNNSFWPVSMLHAREIVDPRTGKGTGRIVATLSGHHDVDQCGEIGIFDPALGREEAAGCLHLWPPRPIQPIKNEFYWRALEAQYQYPWPLSEAFFLVSCRPRGRKHFGIYLVDTFGNRVLIHEEAAVSCASPMPLAPRPRPPVVPTKVDFARTDATVYLADVYHGEAIAGVKRGEVKALRVIEMINRPTGTRHWAGMDGTPPMGLCSSWDAKRVLGTVPVSADGSAYFTVPAPAAVYFQPLDAKGRALQWMRSWATAQPGEMLACAGCHESKRQAPPARLRPAPGRTPDRPAGWHAGDRAFSFPRDVQPVLDRACVRCHDHNHKRGLDLRGDKTDAFSLGYEHLRLFVKVPGTRQDPPAVPARFQGAVASPLIRMLDKGHHKVKLTPAEYDRLVTWVDLNALYYGSYAIRTYDANFGRCVVKDARGLWQAIGQRCFSCHKKPSRPPGVPEGGFARFGKHQGRRFDWATGAQYDMSNAVLINLTHPTQSRLLRAALPKSAGGLGLHKGEKPPLTGLDDPVYQAAVNVIQSWSDDLKRRPREDMPGAVPCKEYLVWQAKRRQSDAIERQSRRNLARPR